MFTCIYFVTRNTARVPFYRNTLPEEIESLNEFHILINNNETSHNSQARKQ